MKRKGIILAGGSGTRLYPLTKVVSKQMLPVYDKPMVYYPLTSLMLAGIDDILLISTPHDTPLFQQLLGDGSQWGISIQYAVQPKPAGIAQALVIATDFLSGDPSALILGDNLFYGDQFGKILADVSARQSGCSLFAYRVHDPERYGVVELDENFHPVNLVEKPENPKSNFAVTGLYFYDGEASRIATSLKPSARGEVEITDLNRHYLEQGDADVTILGRGYTWLDTGTPQSLIEAGQFIETIQNRQGLMIACPEEIALNAGWIGQQEISQLAEKYSNSLYGQYLNGLLA